jgi:hypothetical protein
MGKKVERGQALLKPTGKWKDGINGLNSGDDVAPQVSNPGQMAMGASEEPSSPSNRARVWHEASGAWPQRW